MMLARRPLLLPLPLLVLLLATGCAVDRMRLPRFDAEFAAGNYQAARAIAAKATMPSQPHRALLWQLQEAAVGRMQGDYRGSNAGFDRCESAFKHYDLENAAIAGGKTAVTVLANDSLRPYSGQQYDRIMVNTYKALNFAAQGEHELARVEFNRALQRQDRAKERFAEEIARARREVARQEAGQGDATEKTVDSPEGQKILAEQYSNLDQFQTYPDFVNPFSTYVAGLYFLLCGDHGKALDILKEAHGMLPGNAIVADDFAAAHANRRVCGRVYVFFENGMIPRRDEIRIDLPLFLVTRKVLYTGIALPRLAPRSPAFPYLDVMANGSAARTVPLASMDAVVATEFRKQLPTVVARAVASAVAKAAVQYVAREQMGELAGLLAAGYSAVSTAADQRTWSSLPKEIQVAAVALPADRQLTVQPPGAAPLNIPLPPCVNVMVCVRIPQAGAPPAVQIIPFNQ